MYLFTSRRASSPLLVLELGEPALLGSETRLLLERVAQGTRSDLRVLVEPVLFPCGCPVGVRGRCVAKQGEFRLESKCEGVVIPVSRV